MIIDKKSLLIAFCLAIMSVNKVNAIEYNVIRDEQNTTAMHPSVTVITKVLERQNIKTETSIDQITTQITELNNEIKAVQKSFNDCNCTKPKPKPTTPLSYTPSVNPRVTCSALLNQLKSPPTVPTSCPHPALIPSGGKVISGTPKTVTYKNESYSVWYDYECKVSYGQGYKGKESGPVSYYDITSTARRYNQYASSLAYVQKYPITSTNPVTGEPIMYYGGAKNLQEVNAIKANLSNSVKNELNNFRSLVKKYNDVKTQYVSYKTTTEKVYGANRKDIGVSYKKILTNIPKITINGRKFCKHSKN